MNILFAAHDVGGMNAITPVVQAFRRKHPRSEVFGIFTGPAMDRSHALRIPCIRLAAITPRRVAEVIRQVSPDVIVTGTSSGTTVEKMVVPIARDFRIPTIAVLDAWVNYNYQFSSRRDGSFSLADLPDRICVPDATASREMGKAGFPKDRLAVTGNPFFETFVPFPPVHRKANRKTVVFVDQHFSELVKKGVHEAVGFHEAHVFRDVAAELGRRSDIRNVVIRLHPGSKDHHRYDRFLHLKGLDVRISSGPLEPLLRSCDVVIGMNSAVLFESALRGKTVVSYQPGATRSTDPLMSNRLGISFSAYSLPGLRRTIQAAITQPRPRNATARIRAFTKSGATQAVCSMIERWAKRLD